MVLILIFAEVLGLYGYGFIVVVVSIQRIADVSIGQTHCCTNNEYQSNGRKVFIVHNLCYRFNVAHSTRPSPAS